jgi:hypothetical protein
MERMEVSHLKSLFLLLVAQKQTERICSKKSIQPSDTAHNSPPACGPHLACPEDCRKHWGGNNFGHQTELPRCVASLQWLWPPGSGAALAGPPGVVGQQLGDGPPKYGKFLGRIWWSTMKFEVIVFFRQTHPKSHELHRYW